MYAKCNDTLHRKIKILMYVYLFTCLTLLPENIFSCQIFQMGIITYVMQ